MKVVIVSNGIPTPAAPLNGIFAWDQALALQEEGVEVAFVALDFRRKWDRKMGKDYFARNEIPVFQYSLPTGMYRHCLVVLQKIWKSVLQDVIQIWGKPDVVHAHFYFMGAIVARTYDQFQIPVVLTEHSSKLNKPLEKISRLDQFLAKRAYATSKSVLAVSTTLANNLKSLFSTVAQVVPNVVDWSAFHYESTPTHLPFQFVSVGRLIPEKGMDILIQAFAAAQMDPNKVQLKIIGAGPEAQVLQDLIKRYGLEEQIHLVGEVPRSEIAHYFMQSDAFVLLSQRETFGLSYVEAMSMGLPVIASPCGGPTDFMNEERGILLPDVKITTVASALHLMVNEYPNFCKDKIAASIRQEYSAHALAERLKKIYQHVTTAS